MQFHFKLLLSLSLFIFFQLEKAEAQKIYIDSLEKVLIQTSLSREDSVVVLCKLARANFEKNLKKSFKQANEALRISAGLKDGKSKAVTFATFTHLYVQQNDLKRAQESLDSAHYYASRTKDRVAKGFVWFRSGWLDLVNGENDKSIVDLLKALNFLNGEKAYSYESYIYHYMASIYGYGNDPIKQKEYARLCYETAIKSREVDNLNTAYFTLGHSYLDQFKVDTTKRALLDSALIFNKRSLDLSAMQEGRLLVKSNTAAAALNTANIYFQFFPYSFKDSATKYIDIAIGIAQKTKLNEVILNCYGILSEYAMQEGKYDDAEKILLEGLSQIDGDVMKMAVTKARLYLALSRIAEKKGDQIGALNYLKEYIQYNKEAFDQEKMATIQKIDAQYQSEKKEQEIINLQQQASFNRKMNIFYLAMGGTGILVLLLLLSSYNYKLKASLRKQELVDKEKQEAELQSKLKEAESRQLAFEKQEAILQANLQAEEAVRLQTEQMLLKERQERLQKELLAGTLQIEEKNELLELLSDKVTKHSHLSVDEQIKRIVSQHKRMDKNFEEHKTDFFEINPVFFERLQQKAHNTLTRLDLKYCSYILMGLSNKEVSARLGIEPKSIRMARYRIKQKLGLLKDDSLDNFLRSQEY